MPTDNLVLGATTTGLPVGSRIGALVGTLSGDTDAAVGPCALVDPSGAEGSWAFTVVRLPTALGANGGIKVDIVGDTGTATTLDTDDGSVAAAQASIPLVIPLRYTWNGSAWVRGGFTPYKLLSAASTNGTSVKASAGTVGMIACTNTNAAVRYLKFYNKASAPTVGTDTPVQVFAVPGNTAGGGRTSPSLMSDWASARVLPSPSRRASRISDTGAVAANELIVNLGWL